MGTLRLPDGRVIEMVNDEIPDDELLEQYETEPDTEEEFVPNEAQQIMAMAEHINKLHYALDVAHNLLATALMQYGNILLDGETMKLVTSAERYTFKIEPQTDGNIYLELVDKGEPNED